VLEDRGGELLSYKESRVVKVRSVLVGSLEAMDAGGLALRWARHLLPVRHAEPAAWAALTGLLDALDVPGGSPRARLALAGFRLLSSVGYALELERCVQCGRPCPEGAPAFVDAARGGLVCRRCGGHGKRVDGRLRAIAARAERAPGEAREGEDDGVTPPEWMGESDAGELLGILADAMAAHAGMDVSSGR